MLAGPVAHIRIKESDGFALQGSAKKFYSSNLKDIAFRESETERSRVEKIKNIKKQNLLYGCFKKQSTQKISNQKMKLKERDKSILEYVQCMYNNVHAYKVPGF